LSWRLAALPRRVIKASSDHGRGGNAEEEDRARYHSSIITESAAVFSVGSRLVFLPFENMDMF
jgi:hypothetical protein